MTPFIKYVPQSSNMCQHNCQYLKSHIN